MISTANYLNNFKGTFTADKNYKFKYLMEKL